MNQLFQFVIMTLIFMSLAVGIHYYLWLRMVHDTGMPSPWREISTGLLVLLGISIPITLFISRMIPFEVSRFITWLPYTWLAVMMLLFISFLAADSIKLLAVGIKKLSSSQSLPMDHSRRNALGQLIAGTTVLAVTGVASAGVIKAARKAVVKTVHIPLSHFPKAMDGLKIVQISDLHIGITVGKQWLTDLVNRINTLNPDIVAITGDLTDGDPQKLYKEIEPLKHLETTYGTFFVTGNHEYYSDATRWIEEIRKLGINVLRNQSVAITKGEEQFFLAGVDDYNAANLQRGHGQNVSNAIAAVPDNAAVVMLAHQPRSVFDAADVGVDLVLAGHTHGGQIWPFTYLVGLQQPYNKGLYAHNQDTQIYVNQGTFMWGPPMRVGTECEITEIILSSKQKNN